MLPPVDTGDHAYVRASRRDAARTGAQALAVDGTRWTVLSRTGARAGSVTETVEGEAEGYLHQRSVVEGTGTDVQTIVPEARWFFHQISGPTLRRNDLLRSVQNGREATILTIDRALGDAVAEVEVER